MFFSAGPYYLAQKRLSCKNNATTRDGLFSTYYCLTKLFFTFGKPIIRFFDPEME